MSETDWNYLDVEKNNEGQSSAIAKIDIPAETFIGSFDGRATWMMINEDGLLIEEKWQHREVIQLYKTKNKLLVLTPVDDFNGIDYINHSCTPNAYVHSALVILTNKIILKDTEITIDYRKIDLVSEGVKCWCDPPQCII